MSATHCLLTLDVPRALEDEVLQALRRWPQWSGRVQRLHSDAWGQDVDLRSAREKMHNCAQRTQLQTLIAQAEVAQLVAALQALFPRPDLLWWATPVLDHGSLA